MKKKGISFDGGPVGYKRPPVEHQFKKGQKPPGSGRRRESKNYETIAGELLESRIMVIEGGKKVRMSRKEALFRRAYATAMSGRVNDVVRFFALVERLAPAQTAPEPLVMLVRNIDGDEAE